MMTVPSTESTINTKHVQMHASGAYDKKTVIDYYQRLYGFAPDYLDKKIKQIDEMAAL